jgi:hypothetical protein
MCVLFLLKAVFYGGRDFYRIKNSLLFFPLAHEYRKFVENKIGNFWGMT